VVQQAATPVHHDAPAVCKNVLNEVLREANAGFGERTICVLRIVFHERVPHDLEAVVGRARQRQFLEADRIAERFLGRFAHSAQTMINLLLPLGIAADAHSDDVGRELRPSGITPIAPRTFQPAGSRKKSLAALLEHLRNERPDVAVLWVLLRCEHQRIGFVLAKRTGNGATLHIWRGSARHRVHKSKASASGKHSCRTDSGRPSYWPPL
jgi:hypothetical protein